MRRRVLGVVTVVAVAAVCGGRFAGRVASEELPPKPTAETDLAKLESAIAATSLKLAETELQVLVDANERLANTFPRSAVERARQQVGVARQRVDQADEKDGHANYIAQTEALWKAADFQYRSAAAANRQVKNAVPALELERIRLAAELAKLRFERAQQAKNVSETVLLAWQMEDLQEQVRRLAHQLELYRGNE